MSWNLSYKQKSPTIDAFKNVNPGLLVWEKLDWLIKMPRAEVRGDIQIGEKKFQIDALGYSDTNWGKMMPFFSKYEWGQYNEKSFSLVFGVLYGLWKTKATYLYLIIHEHLIKIENAKFEIKHIEWKKDEIINIKIPTKSIFYIKNEEYEIKFSTNLIYSDSMGMQVSSLLPKVVVSEQVVKYKGSVKKNGVVIYEFQGTGFEEWSGKTWKKVPLAF